MHEPIRRWLAWARAVFRTSAAVSRAGHAAPQRQQQPVDDASYWVWVTAHGIDFRPRVPHHDTEAAR